MKTLFSAFACTVLLASLAAAAGIDGKWVSERKMSRDGQEFTIKNVFDLKSAGAKLTGSIAMTTPMGERTTEIKEGKVDGNKFSFTTVMETPNGEFKMKYEGTVDGDTLKGTTMRDGGDGQSRPFEAKRQ